MAAANERERRSQARQPGDCLCGLPPPGRRAPGETCAWDNLFVNLHSVSLNEIGLALLRSGHPVYLGAIRNGPRRPLGTLQGVLFHSSDPTDIIVDPTGDGIRAHPRILFGLVFKGSPDFDSTARAAFEEGQRIATALEKRQGPSRASLEGQIKEGILIQSERGMKPAAIARNFNVCWWLNLIAYRDEEGARNSLAHELRGIGFPAHDSQTKKAESDESDFDCLVRALDWIEAALKRGNGTIAEGDLPKDWPATPRMIERIVEKKGWRSSKSRQLAFP